MKWIITVVCCAFAATALAQEIRRHRTGAGTFTVNTWALAESTEGRYSVLMPAPFDDYTQEANDSKELHGYYLRARMADTTLFSALRAEYADAEESARNCRRMREDNGWGAALKSRRTLKVDGRDAVEIVVDDGRAWMVTRVICLKKEGVMLAIAVPRHKIAYAQSVSGKFFDSLKIRED